LNTKETRNRFKEFWYPALLDRSIRPTWLEAGATTLGARLNKRVEEIIKEHKPEPLSQGTKKQIKEILSRAA
jgi:trimethylamine:corrinoid methyltransferase-like protein